MSLISIQVPNLIQGVSQQPPQMRLPSQLSEQVNAYPSLTDGLTKRPPSSHVAKLSSSTATPSFIHFINRDSSERYVVWITATALRVFTLDGVEKNVYTTLTGDTAFTLPTYLASPGNLRAVTIADYTFLLNRNQTTAMTTATSAAAAKEALVTVIQVGYTITYTVTLKVGSVTYSYTYTSPGSGSQSTISTEAVITSLVTSINAATSTTGLAATSYGSTLLVSHTSTDFSVKVSDSAGGSYMTCAKGKVARLADLPKQGKHGFKVAVGAAVDSPDLTDYYVQFVANDAVSGSGYWEETVGFSVPTAINGTTMPLALARRSDGHFACITPTWSVRAAGDDTTAPKPSFIGRKLKDIFLFRNRLGFVADDKVVLSEAGFYYNFFRTTTAQLIDSDPIDVSVGHSKIASLESALPWDERLILFSPLTQFSLGSGGDTTLTPKSVEVIQTTEFENACELCRPEATGRSLLFLQRNGTYTGVREYIRISAREQYDAMNLTANAPAYISGTPKTIAVSSHDSVGFILTDAGLWNYKWFVNGNEKIQSAWSKFNLGSDATVLGIDWIDHYLYLVVARASQTYLEKIDFGGRFIDSDAGFGVHLDRRIYVVGSTSGASTNCTRFSTSSSNISYNGLNPVVVVDGIQRDIVSVTSTYVEVIGQFNGKYGWVGVPYDMSWTFSTPFLRNNGDAIIDGRLQLTYGKISYESTGHFLVTVTPKNRDSYHYVFDGGRLGADLTLGTAFLETDSLRFPIHCKNVDATITVSSDSFLPCRIQSASFEGNYTTRSRAV